MSGWGLVRGCPLLYQSLYGRMRMVRALGFVCATIMAKCSASIVVYGCSGWARPLPAHLME